MGDIVVPEPVIKDKNVGFVLLRGTSQTRVENEDEQAVAAAEVTEEWDGRISRCIVMPRSHQIAIATKTRSE